MLPIGVPLKARRIENGWEVHPDNDSIDWPGGLLPLDSVVEVSMRPLSSPYISSTTFDMKDRPGDYKTKCDLGRVWQEMKPGQLK